MPRFLPLHHASWGLTYALLGACSALVAPDRTRLEGSGERFDGGRVDASSKADARVDGGDAPDGSDGALEGDGSSSCIERCEEGELTRCSSGSPLIEPCALGCAPDGSLRCASLSPSHVGDLEADEVDVRIEGTLELSTNECEVEEGRAELRTAEGQTVCIWSLGSLYVERAGSVHVIGEHPLLVVAQRDVTIDGDLDVSARGTEAGPGAQEDGASVGEAGEHGALYEDGGGGGGGGCGTGGTGGNGGEAPGGRGGAPSSAPLRGGGRGGTGGGSTGTLDPRSATGGGGGGYLQISALGNLRVTGRVLAGGGGGMGGLSARAGGNYGAGGGGGAGGRILLEGTRLSIADGSTLLTSGGGGGSGSSGDDLSRMRDGADGTSVVAGGSLRAAGGVPGVGTYGAPGGESGGGVNLAGEAGETNPRPNANGGGGGGGAGCIALRGGVVDIASAAVLSPGRSSVTIEPPATR